MHRHHIPVWVVFALDTTRRGSRESVVTIPSMSQDDKSDDPQGQPPPNPGAKSGETAAQAGEAFKQGMGLLWQAAVAATDEIKREVDRAEVSDTLQQAGRDLETAAQQAAQALEGFIDRVNTGKRPPAGDNPFPQGGPANAPPPKNEPDEDGGVDEDGNRRDVRIQLEDDDGDAKDEPGTTP